MLRIVWAEKGNHESKWLELTRIAKIQLANSTLGETKYGILKQGAISTEASCPMIFSCKIFFSRVNACLKTMEERKKTTIQGNFTFFTVDV